MGQRQCRGTSGLVATVEPDVGVVFDERIRHKILQPPACSAVKTVRSHPGFKSDSLW